MIYLFDFNKKDDISPLLNFFKTTKYRYIHSYDDVIQYIAQDKIVCIQFIDTQLSITTLRVLLYILNKVKDITAEFKFYLVNSSYTEITSVCITPDNVITLQYQLSTPEKLQHAQSINPIQEPMISTDYIGKLCWFWDDIDGEESKCIGFLASIEYDPLYNRWRYGSTYNPNKNEITAKWDNVELYKEENINEC